MELDNRKNILKLSCTDLDSYVNIVVLGKYVSIMNNIGRRAEVSSFTPDYKSLRSVPTVDAAIRHNNLHSRETFLLIVRNISSVLAIDYNLILSFISREVGVDIKCTSKIQCKNPDEEDYSVYFEEENL